MKTTVLMVFLLVVSAAMFGQVGGSSIQPVTGPTYSVPDHPMHASQSDLRQETSLLGSNGMSYAQGERPLWEFPDLKYVKPLGDVAREYRAYHATAEKATRVWNQQGQ